MQSTQIVLFNMASLENREDSVISLLINKVEKQFNADEDILNGWFDHFKELASKKENDNFDLEFLKLVEEEDAIIYMICLDSSTKPYPDRRWNEESK